MIPRLHKRSHSPHGPLAEALGRPLSPDEDLTKYTLVATWPGPDHFTPDNGRKTWTCAEWAEHLEVPYQEYPSAASPDGDRRAILHLSIRLHADDPEPTCPEWSEAAHRFARAAGIEIPTKDHGCRWIAITALPRRLDLIANLIHLDGAWHAPPADVLRRLANEARRIEQDLHLIPVTIGGTTRDTIPVSSTTSAHLASVLTQLADEQVGPLATARGLIEHTAQRIARR
ncbi:relaxase/mobilization nuclease, partial [Streptomyces sp. 8L]|uniref:relaxase/mobilization nuclease n=1 Tax=Streptomyces sp. 8L TaxID=2877242 RepID=UPI001CD52D89